MNASPTAKMNMMILSSRWRLVVFGGLFVIILSSIALFHDSAPTSVKQSINTVSHGKLFTSESLSPKKPTSPPSTTSKFHLLVPASGSHFRLCRAITSSTLLGYPAPVLNGWMKQGELNASETHLAKVRTVLNYLDSLPQEADDDLVLMVDGYDLVFQLPPEIMIERYFAVIKAANAKIAAQWGVDSVDELTGNNAPRQTILFGPEKTCYPTLWNRIGCWATWGKDIDIPVGAYGTPDGSIEHNQPIGLNSGTIIGPTHDMRRMFRATLRHIAEKYDPQNVDYKDSDQMYMGEVWGEQEWYRSIQRHQVYFHDELNITDFIPDDGTENKTIPKYDPKKQTEFHIGIDHRGALFQTRAGSDAILGLLSYNETGSQKGTTAAQVTFNTTEIKGSFQPYWIDLPTNLAVSITRLLESISQAVDRVPAISELRLGTNVVTRNVYAIFHCTGPKEYIDDMWYELWFFPYARQLVDAAVKALREKRPIGTVEGRNWVPAHTLPQDEQYLEVEGVKAIGAWSDLDNVWVGWDELCGKFEGEVFDEPKT